MTSRHNCYFQMSKITDRDWCAQDTVTNCRLVSGCITADTALTQRIFAESVKFEHNGCVQGTVVNCRRAVGKLRRASLQ